MTSQATEDTTPGRRERKKAATRAAIATAALTLFLERGFDAVGIREVAAQADVAVATVFKHFDSKEALLFDEDDDMAAALILAVRERAGGVGVLDALEGWFLQTNTVSATQSSDPSFASFMNLVNGTPALLGYWRARWQQHEPALAAAIRETSSANALTAKMVAHLALDGYTYAVSSGEPGASIAVVFDLLRNGSSLG
ncbi:TetR family transcriptional regulator [Arthrobacter livingstonensis]|uniref:TetR family transcriptional regulator n=1 Tax=Arthrobacter livingstonensis TaxID=670078 RepID=A0A2V5L4V6_9MICC|nr:TetR family transcriptional regulator [Arthrobacter livingstonensis]PYI66389.1 TetR family transcriptional regulator [Arthrobacter livingstonensis]